MNSPIQSSGLGSSRQPAIPAEWQDRWELALRVTGSSEFAKSVRLRNFLLYICRKALTDSQDEIYEQIIGSAVFGRRPDYNCAEDNIVRVEARELRRRLDRYFEGDGKREKLRIRIPKGRYVPLFETQSSSAEDARSPNPAVSPTPRLVSSQLPSPASGKKKNWLIAGLALMVVILLVANLRSRPDTGNSETHPTKLKAEPLPSVFWPLLFNSTMPTSIVVSDCPLVEIENRIGKQIPIEDYISGKYFSQLNYPPDGKVVPARLTSLANAIIIAKILRVTGILATDIRIRYARDLTARDLENGNLIFLGSSYSNPWITEFDGERNFHIGLIPVRHALGYQNRFPRPGEQPWYSAYGTNGKSNETYGLITFLPNLHRNGNVLILGGTTTEGTEAAGDFITDPSFPSRLQNCLRLKSGYDIPYFELLLKTTMLGGAATGIKIVTSRIITAS